MHLSTRVERPFANVTKVIFEFRLDIPYLLPNLVCELRHAWQPPSHGAVSVAAKSWTGMTDYYYLTPLAEDEARKLVPAGKCVDTNAIGELLVKKRDKVKKHNIIVRNV